VEIGALIAFILLLLTPFPAAGDYSHKRLFGLPRVHLMGASAECSRCHSIHSPREGALLLAGERETCSTCHDLPPAKTIHKPVAEGRCSPCHLSHSGESKGLLRGQGDDQCTGCHPAKVGGAHQRGNLPGRCLDCHPPHGSLARRLTRGTMAKPQCLICHGIMLRGRNMHTAVQQKDCSECHNPHSTPPVPVKPCVSCHVSIGKGKVVHQPMEKGCGECHATHTSPEAKLLFSPVPDHCTEVCHPKSAGGRHGPVEHLRPCTVCHDPHASDLARLIRPGFGGLACLDCHGAVVAKPVVHATAAAGRCADCHDPHNPAPRPPVKCVDCHDAVAVGKIVHAPAGEGCLKCHDPHGSVNRYQLRSLPPGLCLTCHTKMAGGRHLTMTLAGECLSCHRPHASGRPGRLAASADLTDCAACHPARKGGRSIHKPVAAGECAGCHSPHSDPPLATVPCASCHDRLLGGVSRHAPVLSGNTGCLKCHAAHGSDRPRLLTADLPALCLSCHPEKKGGLHRRSSMGTDCLACHLPHSASFPRLRRNGGWSDCEGCHQGKRSGRHVHSALTGRPCGECHDPHRQPPLPSVGCRDCHESLAQKNAMHGNLSQKQCLECHTPHSAEEKVVPMKESSSRSCLPCHDDLSRALKAAESLHRALRDAGAGTAGGGDCGACHTGHDGAAPFLKKRYSLEYQAPWTPDAQSLCWGCHNPSLAQARNAAPGASGTPVTSFRDGTRNLHFVHAVGDSQKGFGCWVCHDAHAGFQKHLLNDAPTFNPGRRLALRFVGDPGGGSCESACHPLRGYNR
jgi:predicted CXXCH cytochrome family protein